MITSACAGYSTWRDLDVTRWREDATRDCWGQFYYVRDLSDERMWSIGSQPLPKAADECAFELHPDRAEFSRWDGDVETRCTGGTREADATGFARNIQRRRLR